VALLGRLERLKVLDLSMCERITGSGFLAFGGCMRMATLSHNGCSSLNDSGLRAVGRITSLTKLDLSSCRLITDVGVSYLSGLGELTGKGVFAVAAGVVIWCCFHCVKHTFNWTGLLPWETGCLPQSMTGLLLHGIAVGLKAALASGKPGSPAPLEVWSHGAPVLHYMSSHTLQQLS
jgi:hypothetical protein